MNQADRFLEEQFKQTRPEPFSAPQPVYGWQRMATMGEAWGNFWTRWTFTGRASRSEYWFMALWLFLINMGVSFVTTFLSFLIADMGGNPAPIMILSWIISLLIAIPNICLVVRRLHDIGYSGWWWWIGLVPLAGWIVLLVFTTLPSEPRSNRYGPVPFFEQLPNA